MMFDSLKEIYIYFLQLIRGELGEFVCRDWIEDGNIVGYIRMIYKGLMVYLDIIKGRIEFMGNVLGGILFYLVDEVIEFVNLICIIFYEE